MQNLEWSIYGVDLSWMDGFTVEILGYVVSEDCLAKVDVDTQGR
jgi:hypothetical protein